jgi:D-glycero-D-manno-heptose 1,7-bisphosphate phosphatase
VTNARSALFLDRDGVIVDDPGYLSRSADVSLLTGAADLIAAANTRNIPVVVVTNQSGIARGLFDWGAFESVQQEIARQLDLSGVHLDAVIACPFHPDFTDDYAATGSIWRKPAPGMITQAAEQLNIDTGQSYMVGDTITDIDAAKAAGLAGAVLVQTGHGAAHTEDVGAVRCPDFSVDIATDAFNALAHLRIRGLTI